MHERLRPSIVEFTRNQKQGPLQVKDVPPDLLEAFLKGINFPMRAIHLMYGWTRHTLLHRKALNNLAKRGMYEDSVIHGQK